MGQVDDHSERVETRDNGAPKRRKARFGNTVRRTANFVVEKVRKAEHAESGRNKRINVTEGSLERMQPFGCQERPNRNVVPRVSGGDERIEVAHRSHEQERPTSIYRASPARV